MKKVCLLKYGELSTKKANIGMFLKTLKERVSNALKDYNVDISFDKGRMYIYDIPFEKEFDVLEKLQTVFGIHEIVMGYELEDNKLESIEKSLKEIIFETEFKTFKVVTKRSDKNYLMNSMEISKYLGGFILKNKENTSVDVHEPDIIFHVEIKKDHAYIYYQTYMGLGGYPVGTLGKGILMLSGGIDSPVAGYLAMKRGVKLEAVYFESPPHTSEEAKNKVLELSHIIGKYQGSLKVHVIKFTDIQETIYKEVPKEYMITMMRRMMYRICERLAYKSNAKVIVNGESIGQVASQTLTSMQAINEVVKIPVIRPVACFDKLEIISLAKKIGTYETSILPYEDCCTIFVPEHPVINPELEKCYEYETYFDYETLIKEAINNEQVLKYEDFKDEYSNYL